MKKIDYLSFMGFCSVIFSGNSDLCAALQLSDNFGVKTRNGEYRILQEKIDGVLRCFVEQKYENGIIRWEANPTLLGIAKIVILEQLDHPHSPNRDTKKIRGIRYYTFNKNPEKLEEALKKCHDPEWFIDFHPNLLLQFIADNRHSDKDEAYLEVIRLLVNFGYRLEECFLYPEDGA
ncbi:MAG: hypothetical protein LBD60_04325 [Puniceicoccales bacterium]|nr:hypothetical protein [Puniceicoccales bacterium]